jgi:hypothetical protein
MKVVIVGNGKCALNKKNGKFIDGCDVVVRIKNFQTIGFEEFVGEKIDFFSSKWFSWFDRFTHQPLKFDFLDRVNDYLFMFFNPFERHNFSEVAYRKLYEELQLKNEFRDGIVGTPELHSQYLKEFGIDNKTIHYMTPEEIEDLVLRQLRFDSSKYLTFSGKLTEPTCGIRTIHKMLNLHKNDEIFITGFDGFMTTWYWNESHKTNPAHAYINEILYLKRLTKSGRVINLDE